MFIAIWDVDLLIWNVFIEVIFFHVAVMFIYAHDMKQEIVECLGLV